MKRIAATAVGLAAIVAAAVAFAQTNFPTQQSGINSPGSVDMCLDSKNVAVPCSGLSPLPVRIVSTFPPYAYPVGATPITGSGSGSTGAVVGTLAAAPGKQTYICGFDVSAIGGTAAVGPIVIANLTGGSFTYQGSSSAAGVTLSRTFTPCIPTSTVNTAITTTTTANGTATAVNVNSWGFQL